MKRFALLISACLGLLAAGSCQVLFQDDFQSATNRFSVGKVDEKWTLYNDDNTPASGLAHFDQAWNVYRDADGSLQAASVSYFTRSATADRWMVSPAIDLSSATKPVLVFRAKRMDAEQRDGFEVKLSTAGIEKSDFSVSLHKENYAANSWTFYTVDLSEYAGKTVHIAFIQNSNNKYVLCVDDIVVYNEQESSALVTGLTVNGTVRMANATEQLTAKAVLLNTGSKNITSYTLCHKTDKGETVRQNVSNVNIEPGKTLDISVKPSLNGEGNHTFSLWVEKLNGKDFASNVAEAPIYSILLSSLPHKNLLLEMFSSGMCTNCEPLNRWIHPILVNQKANATDNSGDFTVAKFQVNIPSAGDPTVTEQTLARGDFYNVPYAPCVYMNGRVFTHTDTTIGYHIRDSIAAFRQVKIPTGLRASMERDGGTFKIHVSVTNYLPDANDYNLVVCLIEDSIHHLVAMHNKETDYYNVVRQMVPNVTGTPIVPETVGQTIEKDFEYTFNENSPTVYSSFENMGAVIFLQSQDNSKQVPQAFYLKPGFSVSNGTHRQATRQLSVYPNPAGEHCFVAFEAVTGGKARLQLIDATGKTVRSRYVTLQEGSNLFELETAPLGSGLYFVRLDNEHGVFTHKLIKR
ncbi:MAG: choice-of-anchor J domain-containing protein [Bacteroides sp.]|nr:choice-of-anchor J domain-containing protein [Ruminococcus flavefaciens]MCM1555280.1 choice-of-anchor J domain-containing protein [Bacteroides sp.]